MSHVHLIHLRSCAGRILQGHQAALTDHSLESKRSPFGLRDSGGLQRGSAECGDLLPRSEWKRQWPTSGLELLVVWSHLFIVKYDLRLLGCHFSMFLNKFQVVTRRVTIAARSLSPAWWAPSIVKISRKIKLFDPSRFSVSNWLHHSQKQRPSLLPLGQPHGTSLLQARLAFRRTFCRKLAQICPCYCVGGYLLAACQQTRGQQKTIAHSPSQVLNFMKYLSFGSRLQSFEKWFCKTTCWLGQSEAHGGGALHHNGAGF